MRIGAMIFFATGTVTMFIWVLVTVWPVLCSVSQFPGLWWWYRCFMNDL